MACNADFVQFIVDQCSGAGEIDVKKMMGDYCIYFDGVLFGLICDNNLYVKVTETGKAVLKEIELRPPYTGARDHFHISDIEDREYLEDLIKATVHDLLSPKPKSAKPAERNKQVPASLDDVIVPNLVCSQELRAFFVQYLGSNFRYKVKFQIWLHQNPGKTYRDAIKAYPELSTNE